MFNTPKWVLFGLLCFGTIHIVLAYLFPSTITGDPATGIEASTSLASHFANAITFDYEFLDDTWTILRFIFAGIQGTFIFFAGLEILNYFRGR